MFMVRSLYGLNSIGSDWRTMCAEKLRNMDFLPMLDNPEVYRRQARKPNGEE